MSKIKSDVNRFRQIVRGRVREELRKHLGHQELIGKQGKRVVSIPIPQLELPRFVHDPDGKGVGQGDGQAPFVIEDGTGNLIGGPEPEVDRGRVLAIEGVAGDQPLHLRLVPMGELHFGADPTAARF